MKLYCVRHGESTGNRDKVHQSATTPLSEIGLNQARFVAHRFTTIAVDHILSSPYTRALQTAQTISETIDKPVTIVPVLHELDKPSHLYNKPYDHPDAVPYYSELTLHKYEPHWHYRDDENYFDLFHRTKEAFALINKRPEQHLIMVSHGTFLAMFLTMMLFPDEPNLPLFDRFHRFAHNKNTGITIYERNHDNVWRLLTLNDYAHLG